MEELADTAWKVDGELCRHMDDLCASARPADSAAPDGESERRRRGADGARGLGEEAAPGSPGASEADEQDVSRIALSTRTELRHSEFSLSLLYLALHCVAVLMDRTQNSTVASSEREGGTALPRLLHS